jgi:guanylate kinase
MQGKLIIISAPSGAGKTTILKHLLKQNLNLEFSVSVCSRKKRENETDGKDYYFITSDEFMTKIRNNELLEWEEVYKDNFYGTLKSEVDRLRNDGKNVIFDVDVQGGIKIKKMYGNDALAIFIMPPSVEELEKRLKSRLTEGIEEINKRVSKAKNEIEFACNFDKIIINDMLNLTLDEITGVVKEFLKVNK